jgi:hypothetical protein
MIFGVTGMVGQVARHGGPTRILASRDINAAAA